MSSGRDTFCWRRGAILKRVDARVKLVVALAFCLAVVTSPPGASGTLAGYAVLLVIAGLMNPGVLAAVGRRIAAALPLLIGLVALIPFLRPGQPIWCWGPLSASEAGAVAAGLILACALLCVAALALVIVTTPEDEVVAGLCGIGVPHLFAAVIAFMLRYLHVLRPELHRLRDAREARTIGAQGPGRVRSGAHLLGALFVRSFDRSERVADAMAARGFDGRLRARRRRRGIRASEWIGGGLVVAAIVAIRVVAGSGSAAP